MDGRKMDVELKRLNQKNADHLNGADDDGDLHDSREHVRVVRMAPGQKYERADNGRETLTVPFIVSSASSSSLRSRTKTQQSLSPNKALIHLAKGMMGTGLLALPLAFKHAGLWTGFGLLIVICLICLYCMRQVVIAAHYICERDNVESIDYAGVMCVLVRSGPDWMSKHSEAGRQLVNITMFIAQLGFCCVYFVFMADNLRQFFEQILDVHLHQAYWTAMVLPPILALCMIRHLSTLAPLALVANVIYLVAIGIVIVFLFFDPKPSNTLPAFGSWQELPLFFGCVIFAFEGVAIILPIENKMHQPLTFISWNGVLNTGSLLTMILYEAVGFFGYLKFGDAVLDSVTLNLPNQWFFQIVKVLFVLCVMVSYPIQFYAPIERIEAYLHKKVAAERRKMWGYAARVGLVTLTCAMAVLIPHLSLFISLIGSLGGGLLALVFPPVIDLLVSYAQGGIGLGNWIKNILLLCFALIGFFTGTYSSMAAIIKEFGHGVIVEPIVEATTLLP